MVAMELDAARNGLIRVLSSIRFEHFPNLRANTKAGIMTAIQVDGMGRLDAPCVGKS
jgi:hypothetical protein